MSKMLDKFFKTRAYSDLAFKSRDNYLLVNFNDTLVFTGLDIRMMMHLIILPKDELNPKTKTLVAEFEGAYDTFRCVVHKVKTLDDFVDELGEILLTADDDKIEFPLPHDDFGFKRLLPNIDSELYYHRTYHINRNKDTHKIIHKRKHPESFIKPSAKLTVLDVSKFNDTALINSICSVFGMMEMHSFEVDTSRIAFIQNNSDIDTLKAYVDFANLFADKGITSKPLADDEANDFPYNLKNVDRENPAMSIFFYFTVCSMTSVIEPNKRTEPFDPDSYYYDEF